MKIDESIKEEVKKRIISGQSAQKYLHSVGILQGCAENIKECYDAQAGKYIESYNQNRDIFLKRASEIIDLIYPFISYPIRYMIDLGAGDGTMLSPIIHSMNKIDVLHPHYACIAYDISPKRILELHEFLDEDLSNQHVFGMIGNMERIPMPDNSMDLAMTTHSIEPNFYHSDKIISEIIRISRKYILFVEPVYELSNREQMDRMDDLKYFKDMLESIKKNTVKILLNKELTINMNQLNKSRVILLEKINSDTSYDMAMVPNEVNFEEIKK